MARSKESSTVVQKAEQLLEQSTTNGLPNVSSTRPGSPPILPSMPRGDDVGCPKRTSKQLEAEPETSKKLAKGAQPARRRKQTSPKHLYEYESRSTASDMARSGPEKKDGVSTGIQCSLLTEMVPTSNPQEGARGGVRVRTSIDPRKLSNEFLKMDSRKIRMTVVKETD